MDWITVDLPFVRLVGGVEYWNNGILEYRSPIAGVCGCNSGKMEYWEGDSFTPRVWWEYWNNGILEYALPPRCGGILEYWNNGILEHTLSPRCAGY